MTLMVAVNNTDPTFVPGIPRPLFEGPYRIGVGVRATPFDVSPNGQRFLMIREAAATDGLPEQPTVVFVENWFDELQRLVPSP